MSGKITPFDFINSVQTSGNNLIIDEETEKQYNSYIVNRGLSFGVDTVIYANEMNSRPHLEKKMQYDFLLNAIPKKKRFNKWIKAEKDSNIEVIIEYYQCSLEKAKDILRVLTPEQFADVKSKLFKGGKV